MNIYKVIQIFPVIFEKPQTNQKIFFQTLTLLSVNNLQRHLTSCKNLEMKGFWYNLDKQQMG